jgi:hypothetical protein
VGRGLRITYSILSSSCDEMLHTLIEGAGEKRCGEDVCTEEKQTNARLQKHIGELHNMRSSRRSIGILRSRT